MLLDCTLLDNDSVQRWLSETARLKTFHSKEFLLFYVEMFLNSGPISSNLYIKVLQRLAVHVFWGKLCSFCYMEYLVDWHILLLL